jgi:hypothetical protein
VKQNLSQTPFQSFALKYIERGWFIFPLRRNGKEPITSNGFKDASNDPEVINQWASKYPSANIGIATEASNLIVVDCDSSKGHTPPSPWNLEGISDGADVFVTAIANSGNQFDFNTFTVWTPNNGIHYYFHDGGVPIKSGTNVNGLWRVDIRSKGGYIVAPGSVLENGSYEVDSIGSAAQMPLWMRALVVPKKAISLTSTSTKTVVTRYSSSSSYCEAAIKREIRTLLTATEGTRNDSLNRTSFNCGKLVGLCPESRALAINALKQTALAIGLSETEAARTIASAFKAGLGSYRG